MSKQLTRALTRPRCVRRRPKSVTQRNHALVTQLKLADGQVKWARRVRDGAHWGSCSFGALKWAAQYPERRYFGTLDIGRRGGGGGGGELM